MGGKKRGKVIGLLLEASSFLRLFFFSLFAPFFLSREAKEEKIVGSVERDEAESGEKRGKRTKRT